MIPISKSKPYIKKTWRYNQRELRENDLMGVKDWYWETGYYGWIDEETYAKLYKHAYYKADMSNLTEGELIAIRIHSHANYTTPSTTLTNSVEFQRIVKEVSEAMYQYNTVAEFVLRKTKKDKNETKLLLDPSDYNEYLRSSSMFGGRDIVIWDWKDRNVIQPLYRFIAWSLTKLFGYTSYKGSHKQLHGEELKQWASRHVHKKEKS